jgi:hypothetical protein
MTGELATGTLTSTTFDLPGYTVDRTLGMSWGLIVRSVGLTKGLTGGHGAAGGPRTAAGRQRGAGGAVRLLRHRQRTGRGGRLRDGRDRAAGLSRSSPT